MSYGPNRFVRTALREGRIEIFGKGEERRSHVYIGDAVELIGLSLAHRSSGTLNVAYRPAVSFLEVAESVSRLAGRPVRFEFAPRTVPVIHRPYKPTQLFRFIYNLGRPIGQVVHRTFVNTAVFEAFPDFRFTPLDKGIELFLEAERARSGGGGLSMPVAAILGLSSDIGRELAARYAADGWTVWGTYRDASGMQGLPPAVRAVACDLASPGSIAGAAQAFEREGLRWDLLVVAAGTEEPIGAFWGLRRGRVGRGHRDQRARAPSLRPQAVHAAQYSGHTVRGLFLRVRHQQRRARLFGLLRLQDPAHQDVRAARCRISGHELLHHRPGHRAHQDPPADPARARPQRPQPRQGRRIPRVRGSRDEPRRHLCLRELVCRRRKADRRRAQPVARARTRGGAGGRPSRGRWGRTGTCTSCAGSAIN